MDVTIIKRKGEDDSDHVQFAITEKKRKKQRIIEKSESVDVDPSLKSSPRRSSSRSPLKSKIDRELTSGHKVAVTYTPASTSSSCSKPSIGSSGQTEALKGEKGGNDDDDEGSEDDDEEDEESDLFGSNDQEVADTISLLSLENRISPLTFCNAFPFHLLFDRELRVRQVSIWKKQEPE